VINVSLKSPDFTLSDSAEKASSSGKICYLESGSWIEWKKTLVIYEVFSQREKRTIYVLFQLLKRSGFLKTFCNLLL
jgi:hypothetical protein